MNEELAPSDSVRGPKFFIRLFQSMYVFLRFSKVYFSDPLKCIYQIIKVYSQILTIVFFRISKMYLSDSLKRISHIL